MAPAGWAVHWPLRYARAGARVCITDLDDTLGEATRAELAGLVAQACYIHADVTKESDVQAVADRLVQ